MDKSREIVFHLARRLLWAKRELQHCDQQDHQHEQLRFSLWLRFNEAQNSYRVAKMVLDEEAEELSAIFRESDPTIDDGMPA